MRAFPHARHLNAYGMTEMGGLNIMTAPGDDPAYSIVSAGQAMSGTELRIVPVEGSGPVPADEPGELQVRSWCTFDGYYKDPEATARVVAADRWVSTGDLGSLDESQRFTYRGRLKEMLKVGGENVSALEIEHFLCTHPQIRLAAVVGVPDPRYEEVAAAFVELEPESDLSTEAIIEFCRGQIASFKIPRHVRVLSAEQWPVSATKIQKTPLRDSLLEELGLEPGDTTAACSG
jgi:acyl-CoA synthetase (AMP-forming)/AMP-acid ligase II